MLHYNPSTAGGRRALRKTMVIFFGEKWGYGESGLFLLCLQFGWIV
jgi:hypothetical protein